MSSQRSEFNKNQGIKMMKISVVIPVFNEEECLNELYERLVNVLSQYGEYELILVNDGSTDNSVNILYDLNAKDKNVKIIDLSRNFGKEVAMTAGIDYATGDVVILIDADLQDPPELIGKLIEKWKEGYDVVYAKRHSRNGETLAKKLTASIFYRILRRLANFDVPVNTGDFRLLNKKAITAIKKMREKNRFMKGIFAWVGFNSTEVLYDRDARLRGKTKWNYLRLMGLAINGITSFSAFPLRISIFIGGIISLLSFGYLSFIILFKLLRGINVPGYPSLLSVLLFFGGIQMIMIGILGEYIGKIYFEVKDRPLYFIKQMIGFENRIDSHETDKTCWD